MALDSQLTQNINLRANGDALLRPLQAMGNQLNRIVQQMQQVANPSTAKGRQELQQLTQQAQKALSTLRTLNDLINNGSRSGRAKNGLMLGLDEQSFGKQVMNASKLRGELEKTTTASQALELRLSQLYKKFNDLGNAGKAIGQRDIAKALNTQEALRQVQALEREINRLDARNGARGPLNAEQQALRANLGTSYATLVGRIQNERRVDWTKEIAQVQLLADEYKKVTRSIEMTATASARAAAKRRADIMDTINMNEAQLRSSINRSASQFNYTPQQARQFNIPVLNQQVEDGIRRLQAYQVAMSKAVEQGRSSALIDRLARSFGNVSTQVAEASAKLRAFGTLPEQRMRGLNEMLFGGGGWMQFGARIAGASALSMGAFAAFNTVTSGVRNVVELNDALARLQAIAGATDPEMQKLTRSIFDVAETSRYSTTEITQAATQIAQAGYASSDATKVLQGALALATASGSTVAQGVDTMTSTLGAFQLQAGESARVADVLTAALNQSKLSIEQMQAAIQYAGATAHEAGMSLEELATFAAMAANAGIKSGSTIGTGMRMLMVDLQNPTEKFKKQLEALGLTMADIDIKALGFDEVMRNLTRSGFTAESAYKSFEKRSAAFFLALRGQLDTYDDLATAITTSGAAMKGQETAMGSLKAQWQEFKNLITEIVVGLSGPFVTALTGALTLLNGLFQAIVDLNKGFVEMMGGSSSAASEFGGIVANTLIPTLVGFFIGGPWGAIIGAIVGFTGAIGGANSELTKLEAKTNEAKAALVAQKQAVSSVDEAIDRLVTRSTTLKSNSVALQVEIQTLTQRFEGLSSELQGVALNYDNVMSAMLRLRGAQQRDAAVKADETRIAAQKEGSAAIGQLYGNQVSLQGVFNHSYSGYKNAALQGAANYVSSTEGVNISHYGSMTTGQLLSETTNVRAIINNLSREKDQNDFTKNLIKLLKERLDLLEQVKKARAEIDGAERDIGVYREMTSEGGKIRDSYVSDARVSIDEGLRMNKESKGSGEAKLNAAVNLAQARISAMTKQLSQLDPMSAKAMAIQTSIDQLQAEVARVATAAIGDEEKNVHAKSWNSMLAPEVKAALEKEFKGIKIKDAAIRKPGDPLYVPGTLHAQQRALDIQRLPPGITLEMVAKFLEDKLGLELAPGHNGFWEEWTRPATAKTWSGPHGHLGWLPSKPSNWSKANERAGAKDEKTTADLIREGDRIAVQTYQKRLQAILNEAKAGSKPVPEMAKELDDTIEKYQEAALKQFDDANPIKDLSPEQLKIREADREALKDKIAEDARNWHAQFFKQVEDSVQKTLDQLLDELKKTLDQAMYDAEAGMRAQQLRLDTLGNRYNRNQFGDGVLYRENRKMEDAKLQSDQSKLTATQAYADGMLPIIAEQKALLDQLPDGSEAYIEAKKKLLDYQQQYNEALRQTAQLQDSITAQTKQLADVPLGKRLKDRAQAWMENSGAMDSWAKRAENAVGPALDNLSSGVATFFEEWATGQKTFGQALGGMLRSFAMFVVQYIAKCLAMAAITELLRSLGVPIPAAFGGGEVKPAAKGAYEGGPVEIPGRLGGGISHLPDGGSVRRGFTTHDSALYNLAAGEYVVRNKSVRELGLPFMDMINKHGAKGLAAMQGVQQNIVSSPQQLVNVWMVKEGTKPPVSKHDIVVAVADDILQGGQTKQLIQQVAHGG